MKRAVCPGSFDPITYGHLDIIERAAQQFDHVVVAVLENRTKSSLFSVAERIEMISKVTSKFPNVSVDSWSGLLVDYCKSNDIQAIVKGLRASDGASESARFRRRNNVYGDISDSFIFVIISCERARSLQRGCFNNGSTIN